MASSSVSQDDIDNDFEKNSRRSRIRTARARQINPSGCRVESNQTNATDPVDLELGEELNSASCGGASNSNANAANNTINKYDKLVAASDEAADHETSPKPIIRTGGKEKRPNKIHHGNKGKQQRDRRKLREKRRSTGKKNIVRTLEGLNLKHCIYFLDRRANHFFFQDNVSSRVFKLELPFCQFKVYHLWQFQYSLSKYLPVKFALTILMN